MRPHVKALICLLFVDSTSALPFHIFPWERCLENNAVFMRAVKASSLAFAPRWKDNKALKDFFHEIKLINVFFENLIHVICCHVNLTKTICFP